MHTRYSATHSRRRRTRRPLTGPPHAASAPQWQYHPQVAGTLAVAIGLKERVRVRCVHPSSLS